MNNKLDRLGDKIDEFQNQVNDFEVVNEKVHSTETENNRFLKDQKKVDEVKIGMEQRIMNAAGDLKGQMETPAAGLKELARSARKTEENVTQLMRK